MQKLHSSLCLVAIVAALTACSQASAPVEPIRAVKVLTVGTASFDSGYEFAGEVKPRVESKLGFRVAGKLIKRQAEVGQHVQAGQLLAQLDPQDYALAVDAARAQLAAATTNRDLAAADYKRYKELKDQGFISGAELERRDTALKAGQAQLDVAQVQLQSQGNQTGYTQLKADVSGIVVAVNAEPGQVVTAGTPIVQIAQDGARDVVFSVPEDKVKQMKLGADVKVRVWAENRDLMGKIREIAASADPVTRTFAIKVSLSGADAPAIGTTVYVAPAALAHAGVQVIKLPTSALKQDGKTSAVWVLDKTSMTVKSQPIQIATADGNDAVIASGLQPGQLVVSAGVHVLSPGQKVTIYQEKASNSSLASVLPASPATKNAAPVVAAPAPAPASTTAAAK
ncbi:MAG: efflux RND transporter periplasmic adaptor subunit [Burkholderiaceae bacterium]|nr:efflux RND transporter periplasmic adaptor subunit [Burkholderiaceae bacterium]